MRIIIGKILLIVAPLVLLINVSIWLGLTLVPGSAVSYWDFDKYYFGVRSIVNWLNNCPDGIQALIPFRFIYDFFDRLATAFRDGSTIWAIILDILTLGGFSITLNMIEITSYATKFFFHINSLLLGEYNLPLKDYSFDPQDILDSVSSYLTN